MFRRTLIPLGLAVALLAGSAATALADESRERTFRYELRALGQKAGEAVLFIGDETRIGKQKLRPVRIDARTSGLAATLLKTEAVTTSWVDQRWLPVRARWDIALDEIKRVYRTTYSGNRVKGTDSRDGKVFKTNDYRTRERGSDIISIFPWIMHQDMTPGTTYAIEVFDGRRMYDLSITVGMAADIHLPVGLRKAIPLRGRVTRGDAYSRDVEFWISAEEDRTPFKLVFKYGMLGEVEAVLVSQRKV